MLISEGGSGRKLFMALVTILLQRLGKTTQTPLKVFGVQSEILTRVLPYVKAELSTLDGEAWYITVFN
jgi:hypothetical protein